MNWWQRFRAAPRKAQVGIGCGTLLVACVVFSCAGGAFASQNVPAATPTATFRESSAKQPVVTNAPTTAPTIAPTDTTATPPTATPTTPPRPTATPVTRVVVTSTPAHVPAAKPQPTTAPQPTPRPKPTPVPTKAPPTGVYGNPWGYNFSCCHTISSPPSTFCNYFPCITSFWKNTNGYVEQCRDGKFSHSGGRRGACSDHGGEAQALLTP
ncbi:MAG: hypothetical protein ACXWP6_11825 [Ktedonobacterales bacterium]